MIGGELENAVAEPDVFGALAGGGEEGFRRRRMRIFFQKMMFHHPGMVIAATVCGLQLRQRVLVELEFGALLPRARQLQLIKDAEFHDVSPATGLLFSERVYSQQGPSPVRQVQRAKSSVPLLRGAEGRLCWPHEWLVLLV